MVLATLLASTVALGAAGQLSGIVQGQTSVTQDLNARIARGSGGVYTGGKGVLIRNPFDGYEDGGDFKDGSKLVVVPATFWTNDIFAPSQEFPSTEGTIGADKWGLTSYNVDCPNDGGNGYWKFNDDTKCKADTGTGFTSPWNYAATGYVVGSALGNVFYDIDNIQSEDWGWGVFYSTDSNSVDYRCRYIEGTGWKGYDCGPDPAGFYGGGWIPWGGEWQDDPTKKGTGAFPAGNPFANPEWGGGTGCHLDKEFFAPKKAIDQTDAADADGNNLVMDEDCQCNWAFNSNWDNWVHTWENGNTDASKTDSRAGWFVHGKAPFRAFDMAACWHNNIRDMINLQNAIYWARDWWCNKQAPKADWSKPEEKRLYWGWNEVPVNLKDISDPLNHDAMFVKLPADICGNGGGDDSIYCLSDGAQYALERGFDAWVGAKYLIPGVDQIGNRPGSYVVIVREWVDSNDNWQKWFFCEWWQSTCNQCKGNWQINFHDGNDWAPDGACFLDHFAGFGAGANQSRFTV